MRSLTLCLAFFFMPTLTAVASQSQSGHEPVSANKIILGTDATYDHWRFDSHFRWEGGRRLREGDWRVRQIHAPNAMSALVDWDSDGLVDLMVSHEPADDRFQVATAPEGNVRLLRDYSLGQDHYFELDEVLARWAPRSWFDPQTTITREALWSWMRGVAYSGFETNSIQYSPQGLPERLIQGRWTVEFIDWVELEAGWVPSHLVIRHPRRNFELHVTQEAIAASQGPFESSISQCSASTL